MSFFSDYSPVSNFTLDLNTKCEFANGIDHIPDWEAVVICSIRVKTLQVYSLICFSHLAYRIFI